MLINLVQYCSELEEKQNGPRVRIELPSIAKQQSPAAERARYEAGASKVQTLFPSYEFPTGRYGVMTNNGAKQKVAVVEEVEKHLHILSLGNRVFTLDCVPNSHRGTWRCI